MSNVYLEDNQGKVISNPINETNTKYPKFENGDANNHEVDYQYMYNDNEPVSNIDTDVYSSYRNKVEELRTKTESYNEALESCLVPVEIPGMAFQPWEYRTELDDEGEEVEVKVKALQYTFQDHPSALSPDSKEYVFCTNKIKLIDSIRHKQIYDRQIHILSSVEDEEERVSFKDVILRTFYTYYNDQYWCKVRNLDNNQYEINNLLNSILTANTKTSDNEKLVYIDGNGDEQTVTTIADFEYPLKAGIDVNTTVVSSIYNLFYMGWTHACMLFMNKLAIPWTKAIVSVDSIDTFLVISHLRNEFNKFIDDEAEVVLDYIHIPFRCIYTVGSEDTTDYNNPSSQYILPGGTFEKVVFAFSRLNGGVVIANKYDYDRAVCPNSYIDRVICIDPDIKFAESYLTTTDTSTYARYLPDIGIMFNESFRDFCDNDYRCKLKQFNFLGFEVNAEINANYGNNDTYTSLKNDDFKITWHPFNIMDFKFDHLFNTKRLFKIFYNTKVLYDQDNILRLRNHGELSDEYERYRQDVTGNITTYLNEVYTLARRDIGSYIATDEDCYVSGYKYHYVTPYECFILINAIYKTIGRLPITLDEFKEMNVINRPIHYKPGHSGDRPDPVTDYKIGYLNGGFLIYDDEHNYLFDGMITEDKLYDDQGYVRSEIRDFWYGIYEGDVGGSELIDFLIPIDDLRELDDTPAITNIFYMYNGSNEGKIIPFFNFINVYGLEIEDTVTPVHDALKLRFELYHIHNVEEGATPLDELIYYFNNMGYIQNNNYPVKDVWYSDVSFYTSYRLHALAYNIFKNDPHIVMNSIKRLNFAAQWVLDPDVTGLDRDNFITYADFPASKYGSSAAYFFDPHTYFNYGYYDDQGKAHRLESEWCLRRNLPEMFYWKLDENTYSLDSMHLLDEVFDFTYGLENDYEDDLRNGTNYIIGYDVDKLESTIKRGVVSITRDGKWVKDYMANHSANVYTSTNSDKTATFVGNSNAKVTVGLERLIANEDSSGHFTFSYIDGSGVRHDNATNIEMRQKNQNSATLILNTTSSYLRDVDNNYTAYYTAAKTKFNNETERLEFYDASDVLVATLQVDILNSARRLEMSRWNISKQDNFVMIFKNRELYNKYHTIVYDNYRFSVEVDTSNVSDDDQFEFVFFLNANNNIVKKTCTSSADTTITVPDNIYSNGDTAPTSYTFSEATISCNTSVVPLEDVQLLIDSMPSDPNDKYTRSGNSVAYELVFTPYSYKAVTNSTTEKRKYSIAPESRVNGTYRVTKQGGGEYFLSYDGTVPAKTDTITTPTSDPEFVDYGYSTNRTVTLPYSLYITSKRQFHYKHFDVSSNEDSGYPFELGHEFTYCIKNSHVLVFKNGLLLPPTYYYMHSIINTPIAACAIIMNVELNRGDSVDIFYLPNDLHHLECDYYDVQHQERYIKNGEIRVNRYNNEYKVMGDVTYPDDHPEWRCNYIKMRSPLYAVSSKHSVFVFLNGKKVRHDELEDISNTIISINTDYARNEEDMAAVRLEVINHLDTQSIIEQMYINDGLGHDNYDAQNLFVNTNTQNGYKDTLQINSFSLSDLEAYAERSLLDEMLNDLSDENLNRVFYDYINATGPMTNEGIMNEPDFVDNNAIIDTIIDEYYYEEIPEDFIWETIPTSGGTEGESNTIFYIGHGMKIRVPSEYNGEDTNKLYGTTFNRNQTVEKVNIPDGVTRIE